MAGERGSVLLAGPPPVIPNEIKDTEACGKEAGLDDVGAWKGRGDPLKTGAAVRPSRRSASGDHQEWFAGQPEE